MLNHNDCADILGGNVNQYLSNLKLLDLKNTTFRIPVNKFSLNDESLIRDLLKDFKPKKVEIFKLHNLAKRKYNSLGRDFYSEEVSDEVLSEFREIM